MVCEVLNTSIPQSLFNGSPDDDDFNVNWSDGRHARNVFTKVGDLYHGSGAPVRINLQGTGALNP